MPILFRLGRALGAAVVMLSSLAAQANVGEGFGFGNRAAALGNAGVAYGFGGFAAYYNPAALAFSGDQRLILNAGLIAASPSFLPIRNVIVENDYTSDKVTYSDVDNDYRSTVGTQVGLVYRMFPEALNFSFGIAAYLPLNQLIYIDSGETFVPEYVLYRSRSQRPQIEAGFGIEPFRGFKLGMGLHMAYALTGSATVFLQTDQTKPSTMRFAASTKPKIAPTFGALFELPTEPTSPFGLSLGSVVRLPVASDVNMYLRSGARAFGSFAALDFNFRSVATAYYDPLSVEFGTALRTGSWGRTILQMEYQKWSSFEAPALLIQDPQNESCGGSSCGVNISGGKNPVFEYRDIWVPRIGQEVAFGSEGSFKVRAGYAYRPGIFKTLPTGAGNYLDPSKHIFTAGAGMNFKRFLNFDVPCSVDFSFQWHQFLTQQISKTTGDENGNGTGDLKIGAPGYEAGGKILGGGVDLTLAF